MPDAESPRALETGPAPGAMPGRRPPTAPTSRARVRYNAALRLVRRAHLFAGLFMVPWVFLYGITAFLFNHPDAFPDREVRGFGRPELDRTALARFPHAAELARRVVAELDASAGGGKGRPSCRLVRPEDVGYSRDLLALAAGAGRQHAIEVDLAAGACTVRSTARPEARPGFPLADGGVVKLADPPADQIKRGLSELLGTSGLPAEDVAIRVAPDLLFSMEVEGRAWRVSYNLQTGAIVARPEGEGDDRLSTRSFLTRLHLARTYPSRPDVLWFWAVAVDVMAAVMVFWGVSGLLMWWQLRSLRWWGLVALLASLAVASAVALGMHHRFIA